MSTPLATIEDGSCKAEIYEDAMPGQFSVRYVAAGGEVLCEEPLTGVSSYRQREQEIMTRLKQLCSGEEVQPGELSSSGEY